MGELRNGEYDHASTGEHLVAGEFRLRFTTAGVKPCNQTGRTSSAAPKVPTRLLQFACERVREPRTFSSHLARDGARL
jgi:hypothetical protein